MNVEKYLSLYLKLQKKHNQLFSLNEVIAFSKLIELVNLKKNNSDLYEELKNYLNESKDSFKYYTYK